MKAHTLPLISLITFLMLAIVHVLALVHSWYYIFRPLDLIMHGAGGAWVALAGISFLPKRFHTVFIIFLLVLFSGILWEVFELVIGNILLSTKNYWLDTCSDMTANIVGGAIMFALVRKQK